MHARPDHAGAGFGVVRYLTYNAYFGNVNAFVGYSTLHANPYVDHDYVSLSIKYNF